jgi:hypothetical protein
MHAIDLVMRSVLRLRIDAHSCDLRNFRMTRSSGPMEFSPAKVGSSGCAIIRHRNLAWRRVKNRSRPMEARHECVYTFE